MICSTNRNKTKQPDRENTVCHKEYDRERRRKEDTSNHKKERKGEVAQESQGELAEKERKGMRVNKTESKEREVMDDC